MQRKDRILIADDDETFLLSTAELLRKDGFECATVDSVTAAEEGLRRGPYDLLIVDRLMPGNEHLEFVRRVMEIDPGLPVIVLTGYPERDTAMDAVQIPNIAAYLDKERTDYSYQLDLVRSTIDRFRAIAQLLVARGELDELGVEIGYLARHLGGVRPGVGPVPVEVSMAISIRNAVRGLLDVKRIAEAVAADAGDRSIEKATCHLLQCPRLDRLCEAIGKTIEVLEETKNTFHSVQLMNLRKDLERLLDDLRRWPGDDPSEAPGNRG